MARTARTPCTAAPAPASSANGSDDEDDRLGDAKDTEEANKDTNDPDPEPESGPKAGPKASPDEEPVTSWTIKRELTRDYYETFIGLNKTASYALFVDQDMTDMRDFLRVKPENIEKICTAIIKQNKTTIPVMAMERLTLLAYYIKHQERTSRSAKTHSHHKR
jgi:hypothetical protein